VRGAPAGSPQAVRNTPALEFCEQTRLEVVYYLGIPIRKNLLCLPAMLTRRLALTLASPLCLLRIQPPLPASAKPFLDPASRFALQIPDDYVVSKRNSATGTIFVAGNFPRASVISVTAWPVDALLAEDASSRQLPGLPSSSGGPAPSLRTGTIADLGAARDVANLLLRKRDRESNSGALVSVLDGAILSEDGKRLILLASTESPVADPDELERQRGIRKLIRRTSATAVLGSVPSADGATPPRPAIFSVWGSALEQDWDKDLRVPLESSTGSFTITTSPI
jgi:hypothetical protein